MPQPQKTDAGTLYIVPTPIGNLEDITLRALRILKESDLILSEDTRKTGTLLRHYEISSPQKSFRVHRMDEDVNFAVRELLSGKTLSFTTDAGTPGISDPVSHLIRELRENHPQVSMIPLPGASALTTALSVSGWQTHPLLFGGFLSNKSARRERTLQGYRNFEGMIALYESVHRIKSLLLDIRRTLPERDILVAREISKIYEEFRYLPACFTEDRFQSAVEGLVQKGEFTVLIGWADRGLPLKIK